MADIEQHNNTNEKHWDSCCLTLDRQATIFFSQLSIALITISFCVYQLSISDSCERDSLYSGILSLVLGVYLPSPRMGQTNIQ